MEVQKVCLKYQELEEQTLYSVIQSVNRCLTQQRRIVYFMCDVLLWNVLAKSPVLFTGLTVSTLNNAYKIMACVSVLR
jgi:hypothetical protein